MPRPRAVHRFHAASVWMWTLLIVAQVMKKGAGGRSKMSRIENTVNMCIGLILATQALLCSISTILEDSWARNDRDPGYLMLGDQGYKLPNWLANWITFFILYNNFIPISL